MVNKNLLVVLTIVLALSVVLASCGAPQAEADEVLENSELEVTHSDEESFPENEETVEEEAEEREDVPLVPVEENVEVSEATIGGGDPQTAEITTPGLRFSADELFLSVGDSVHFDLGGSHNAVEVTEETWNANGATPKDGGFSVGFGGDQTITFDEAGTYYYVCSPHVGMGMKAKIVVE